MIIIFPVAILGLILLFILIWGATIAAWLWSHAIAVGVVLLVIHVIWSFISAVNALADYSIVGLICSVVHSVFPPITIITAYKMALESGGSFSISLMWNWILLLMMVLGIECLWFTAISSKGGTSYLRFVFFSILNIAASIFLLSLVRTEGF